MPGSCVIRPYERCDPGPAPTPRLECRQVPRPRSTCRQARRRQCRQVTCYPSIICIYNLYLHYLYPICAGSLDVLLQCAEEDQLQGGDGHRAQEGPQPPQGQDL